MQTHNTYPQKTRISVCKGITPCISDCFDEVWNVWEECSVCSHCKGCWHGKSCHWQIQTDAYGKNLRFGDALSHVRACTFKVSDDFPHKREKKVRSYSRCGVLCIWELNRNNNMLPRTIKTSMLFATVEFSESRDCSKSSRWSLMSPKLTNPITWQLSLS